MTDAILYISFIILVFIGYTLVIMMPLCIHRRSKTSLKLCKRWFFLSQSAAFFIALYFMTTERNLVPIIGYIVLIIACLFSGTAVLAKLVIPPNERSPKGKKLLRLIQWAFYCAVFLTLVWTLIWWKEIYR